MGKVVTKQGYGLSLGGKTCRVGWHAVKTTEVGGFGKGGRG